MDVVEIQMRNRLKVLRAERDWSQAQLADLLDVSRQTINAIETGKYDPSLPLAFKMAKLPDRRYFRTRGVSVCFVKTFPRLVAGNFLQPLACFNQSNKKYKSRKLACILQPGGDAVNGQENYFA